MVEVTVFIVLYVLKFEMDNGPVEAIHKGTYNWVSS